MNIYQALKNDHNELKPLLDRLVEASEGDKDTKIILDKIRDALIPHSRAEEAVFYNSLREIKATRDLVAHTYKDHLKAEGILRTLRGLNKINAEWTTLAKKLRESLLKHIQEEENEVFPQARQVFLEEEERQMAIAFEYAKEQAKKQSDMKNIMDMVINLMPKRLGEFMRGMDRS